MTAFLVILLLACVACMWTWRTGRDTGNAPPAPRRDARYQHFLDHGPDEERIP